MDWKTFIVEIIEAVIWPAVVVFVLFIFRDTIVTLIPRLERFKHKETEIEFSKAIQKLEADISQDRQLIEALIPTEPEDEDEIAFMLKLARISPRSAVVEAWRRLEGAAANAIARTYPDLPPPKLYTPRQMAELMQGSILDEDEYRDYEVLRRLRNAAAHSDNFDLRGRPIEMYIDIALSLARCLDKK